MTRPPLPSEVVDHVSREAETVRRAIEAAVPAETICAVGLTFVAGTEPMITMAAVLSVDARDALFERHGDEQALWSLWCPADWPVQVAARVLASRPGADSAARHVRRALRRAGYDDPLALVNHEVCRDLGVHPPEIDTSEDFLAFATEHELSENMFDQLRQYAPPAVVSAYERRNWLRFPEHFEYFPNTDWPSG
jgi:hypothetical protein